jgi:1,2-phenylacetyl-CoA epoxidase PaaB subunit
MLPRSFDVYTRHCTAVHSWLSSSAVILASEVDEAAHHLQSKARSRTVSLPASSKPSQSDRAALCRHSLASTER